MSIANIRLLCRGALLVALVTGASAPAFAQQGTVAGRVIDQATQSPVVGAQVSIAGTVRAALTERDGRYRIDNVTPGQAEVRVRFIGYALASRTITVAAGETATVDFTLQPSAVALDAVIVTATGEQIARALPNAVTKIDAARILEQAPVTSMADLLNSRASNVTVQSTGGTTGAGVRVRVRGSNSVSLSNEPVIVVDGIRVENAANSTTIGVGGQQPSRLNDLNPEDIESIEVVSGPAAAALYGTAAANGILQVRTKRGRPGPARWSFYAEAGSLWDYTSYPANWTSDCLLVDDADGACTQTPTSVTNFNPLETNSPFRTGFRQQYGGSVSGGTEGLRYYVSGEFEDENGIYEISNFTRYNLRSNLDAQLNPRLNLAVSTGYVSSDLQRPQNDNNSFGILPSGYLGLTDATNDGYGFLTPAQSMSIPSFQRIERFTGSVTADWQPFSFLRGRGTVGVDVTERFDEETIFPGEIPFDFDAEAFEGSRAANRALLYSTTANFSATAAFDLSPTVRSNTSVGVQYFREHTNIVFAFGRPLIAGNNSLGGTAIPTIDESTIEAITLGTFIEEQISIRERLFLTAAVRGDDNSAFGKDFNFVVYPKFGASWVISDEPFFPQTRWVNSLRLRAAWGRSGLQPGTTDALLFFTPVAVTDLGADVLGFTVGNLGDPGLKPEVVTELELGFDADLWEERLHFELTYSDKRSRDALIARRTAPSVGGTTTRFENLGEVSNKGVDISLDARVLSRPTLAWDLRASAWGIKNRVIELGEGIEPIIFGLGGASQRHQEGFPVGSYFLRPVTYQDANGDGVLSSSEVTVGATSVFLGTPFPTHGGSLSTTLTLWNRVRLYGLVDGRFGHKQFNDTEEFRCLFTICQALNDRSASLLEQAKAIGTLVYGTDGGYIEDAGFVKLREISATFFAPDDWAGRIGAKGLTLTVSGRNLATWTDYTGLDPEILGGGAANFNTFEFLSQPPVRYFTARINVTF